MDRLKNPALWCAFVVALCAALIHSTIWPDGSLTVKLLTVISEVAGVAGSLFFGAGIASRAVPPAIVLGLLLLGGAAYADKFAPLDGSTSGVAIVGSGANVRGQTFHNSTLGCPSCLVAQLEPSRAQLVADTHAAPAATPVPTDAEKALAVIAALNAAAQNAQASIATAPPVVKTWAETKTGQIVMGCIAGAIIVTSAAGAAAGVIVSLQ